MTHAPQKSSPGVRMGVEYGPLLVFFAVNFLFPAALAIRLVGASTGFLSDLDRAGALVIAKVIVATTAFILATVAAMVVSRTRLGHISPMLWISGGFVVVFGGLTVWFHNPNFIKMKPTAVYTMFAAILLYGWLSKRPLLQALLGGAYPGLSHVGWMKLTRNWAVFFVGMAILNEAVWRTTAPLPTDNPNFWVGFKLWGAIPLTLLFAFANIPMLLRHGLNTEANPEKDIPVE